MQIEIYACPSSSAAFAAVLKCCLARSFPGWSSHPCCAGYKTKTHNHKLQCHPWAPDDKDRQSQRQVSKLGVWGRRLIEVLKRVLSKVSTPSTSCWNLSLLQLVMSRLCYAMFRPLGGSTSLGLRLAALLRSWVGHR